MVLTHAHLVSPGWEIPDGWLRIEEGKITQYGEMSHVPCAGMSLDGSYVLPGFIDIHAHGAAGLNVCDGKVESLESIAERKLAEGVTTWLPTTLTQPPEKLREIFQALARWTPPLSVPGVHLEGPFLNPEMVGAQNPEFLREPDLEELRELHQILPIKILSLAPELPGAFEMIREAVAMGMKISAAHTMADSSLLRRAVAAGLSQMTHFGNAMAGLHHREIGAVGAALLDDHFMLELICDGVHLAPDFLKLVVKVVGLDRLMVITDSMEGSGVADGQYQLGGMKVVTKDGIARLEEGGSLAGSTVKFNEAVHVLMKATNLPLSELVRVTSWNQAQHLGVGDRGALECGLRADLVVLDCDYQVSDVFVQGIQKTHLLRKVGL